MKFRILTADERADIRREKLSCWHKWFAWRPIRLTSDEHEVRWLEVVYRKGRLRGSEEGDFWKWKYADSSLDILKLHVGDE